MPTTTRLIRTALKATQCPFCTTSAKVIDFKDSELLRKYLNPQAKINPRCRTGVCAKHQRMLSRAIKRARHLGLVPYTLR